VHKGKANETINLPLNCVGRATVEALRLKERKKEDEEGNS